VTQSHSPAPGSLHGLLRSRAGMAVASGVVVMNVATYGYTMVAARTLGPQPYGAFAAVMNLLLVVSVASLALQATAARRIAAEPGHVAAIEREIMRVTYRASLGLGAVLLALTPVIDAALQLNSLPTAALVGVAAIPITIMGGQAGILQGERRWRPLAAVYAAAGLPRLVIGTALILWQPDELMAVLGVALGALAPVAIGLATLRPRGGTDGATHHGAMSILVESLRNSQALLAFFTLSNVDLLVARNVLTARDAGLYAAGLILTKGVLFLPQFVVVTAFPSLTTLHERRRAFRQSLELVGGLGLAAVLGSWLLAPVALEFVGGDAYAEIESLLWLFAVLGTVLALLQLIVYSVLARQGTRSTYLIWVAVVALLTGCSTADSVRELLITVTLIDGALLAVLMVISVWRMRETQPASAEVPGLPGLPRGQ
jgi:O-antigen/teichoic acid export membrane protein